MLYKKVIRPFLFSLTPEKAHHFSTKAFKFFLSVPIIGSWLKNNFKVNHPTLEREVFGLKFSNPVGLAAGFDKNADLYNAFSHLGFGFIEVGTVTPKGQSGNPKPRMFRLTKDNGLINRMGFNNEGLQNMIDNLKKRKTDIIIGGNIGKNKVTPNENAIDDYVTCFNALFPYVDYFVVNVSSPNTPNLRDLQEKEPLTKLLQTLQNLNQQKESPKPLLLKIAPDLSNEQLDDIVEITFATKLDGLIATNTTISREGLTMNKQTIENIGPGGLSGKPVKARSTEVIKYLNQKLNNSVPIIGVGGIANAHDVIEKLEAGASLVQVYSGFVYEGPAMVKNINKQLINYFNKTA